MIVIIGAKLMINQENLGVYYAYDIAGILSPLHHLKEFFIGFGNTKFVNKPFH